MKIKITKKKYSDTPRGTFPLNRALTPRKVSPEKEVELTRLAAKEGWRDGFDGNPIKVLNRGFKEVKGRYYAVPAFPFEDEAYNRGHAEGKHSKESGKTGLDCPYTLENIRAQGNGITGP